jgi:DNA-binding transcriptional regulator YdaS (Cro superfamily)
VEAFLRYLETTTQTELAGKLGCHPSAISQWIMYKRIPAERLFQLERITGISPRAMRPDLFVENRRRALQP